MHCNVKDLTGHRFGKLVAIRDTGVRQHKHVVWHCRCDCGSSRDVRSNRLTGGIIIACWKCSHFRCHTENLVGKRYGKLLVVRDTGKLIGTSVAWYCLCDCGKIRIVNGSKLQEGCSKCTACVRRDTYFVDLSGKRFGWLIVEREEDVRTHSGGKIWRCKCRCGNTKKVSSTALVQGLTKSCGCFKIATAMTRYGSCLTPDDIPIGLIKANQLRCQINKELQRN